MIYHYKTFHPYGYNLTSGGNKCIFSEETKEKMRKNIKIGISNNLESHRTHIVELKDLPQYVSYMKEKENGNHGFRIINHPKCKSKIIAAKIIDKTWEELRDLTLKFLQDLDNNNTIYETNDAKKRNQNIPRGLRIRKEFHVEMDFVYKSTSHRKYFSDGSLDENMANATLYMIKLRQELKNNFNNKIINN